MARPKKDNADYHTHDADMRNDIKIKALRRKYGHEGYSVFNMMLEVLTKADFFEYEWTEFNIEMLSADFDTDKLQEIINYCTTTLKLFCIENGFIFSLQHQKRFNPLLSKRKRQLNGVFASENPHSKVKHSIVKNSKGECEEEPTQEIFLKNENTGSEEVTLGAEFVPPEWDEVSSWFFHSTKNYWDVSRSSLLAKKFFNHYVGLKWKTATGAKVEDWKAMGNKWILEDVEAERKQKNNFPKANTPTAPPVSVQNENKEKALIETTFAGFISGAIPEDGIPVNVYVLLTAKSIISLSDEQKKNLFTRCGEDPVKAQRKAVAEFFTLHHTSGNKTVFL